MSKRFFVKELSSERPVRLDGPEAHHLIHVLRSVVGDTVTLFDGAGCEARAEVTCIKGCAVDLAILELSANSTELEFDLVLAAAVPKGDRFGWLIEKATELGVGRFVPLITSRSVVFPGDGKLDKMRRTIVEASKQCRRTRLMELSAPVEWSDFVAREFPVSSAWVAHPSSPGLEIPRDLPSNPTVVSVGPEGGFTDAELELATLAGAKLISLGPRMLRIETAALALAAAFTICR